MLILKKIDVKKDVKVNYKKWMNDKEVHKYSVQKTKIHTIKSIKKYITDTCKSKTEIIYGIFIKQNSKLNHIGNIKLGPINFFHKTAYISYFIGEKKLWNKGYATKAINQIIKIAKIKKIKKLKAGFVEINLGSKKVLQKNGFKKEGTFMSEEIHQKKRFNAFIYGKII